MTVRYESHSAYDECSPCGFLFAVGSLGGAAGCENPKEEGCV